jgi:hypothetical protein
MSIDHGNPPQDFIRDCAEDCVQCKGCFEWVSVSDNRCACNVQCCETCGSACVRYVDCPDRFCTKCDAAIIADCAGDSDCVLETPEEAKRRVLKLEAGTHPAFTGTWMGRVLTDVAECAFDGCVQHEAEEVTARIEPETMAQAVAR